jgi:hypothetical protein
MVGEPTDRKIKWIQRCPAVAWSGDILSDDTFVVNSNEGHAAVAFSVLDPTHGAWDTSLFERVEFQYREVGAVNWIANGDLSVPLPSAAAYVDGTHSVFASEWSPANDIQAGEYEIRVVTLCTMIADSPAEYQQSSTPIVRGRVDKSPPRVVGITASSGKTANFEPGDLITVTFNEPILCSGTRPDVHRSVVPGFALRIADGSAVDDLVVSCDGRTVIVALTAAGAIALGAQTGVLKVTFSNVYDLAGNGLSGSAEVIVSGVTVGGTAAEANAGPLKSSDEEDDRSAASNSDAGSAALSKVRTDYAVVVGVLAVLLVFVAFEYVQLRLKRTEQVENTTDKAEFDNDYAVQGGSEDDDDDGQADNDDDDGARQLRRTTRKSVTLV